MALDTFLGKFDEIWAQDVSPEMVLYTGERLNGTEKTSFYLSVSDGCNLPYSDESFDIVYHFGGINFMPSVRDAIHEMARVDTEDK